MSEAFVEIRDYTIDPEWFAAYKVWASEEAAPWLKANLPVIDFWMDSGMEAEVTGTNPVVSPNGQANVCWILRWANEAERNEKMGGLANHPEWVAIWANHPNENSYLQMNARFMQTA